MTNIIPIRPIDPRSTAPCWSCGKPMTAFNCPDANCESHEVLWCSDPNDMPPPAWSYSPGDYCQCAACVAAGLIVHPRCPDCDAPMTNDRHWCPDMKCEWWAEL